MREQPDKDKSEGPASKDIFSCWAGVSEVLGYGQGGAGDGRDAIGGEIRLKRAGARDRRTDDFLQGTSLVVLFSRKEVDSAERR